MELKNISAVKSTHSPLLWLFPIQSWEQLTSYVFYVSVGLLFLMVVFKTFDPETPNAVFFGAFICSTPPLFIVLPGRFNIEEISQSSLWLCLLEEKLRFLGYRPIETNASVTRYQSTLPRWLRWKENEIYVHRVGEHITVTGPTGPLRALKRKMMEELAEVI